MLNRIRAYKSMQPLFYPPDQTLVLEINKVWEYHVLNSPLYVGVLEARLRPDYNLAPSTFVFMQWDQLSIFFSHGLITMISMIGETTVN